MRLPLVGQDGIPADHRHRRARLSDSEREALLGLAAVTSLKNHRDVFAVVVKTHYRRDGGDGFVWATMLEIARRSGDDALFEHVTRMRERFVG